MFLAAWSSAPSAKGARAWSHLLVGSPCIGPERDIYSHLTLNAQQLSKEAPSLADEPIALLLLHQNDPAESAKKPDQFIGIERDVPGEHLVFGLFERNVGWDLQSRRRPIPIALDHLGEFSIVQGALPLREKRFGLNQKWTVWIWARPHGTQDPTRDKNATDLMKRRHKVHPMPRRRCQHGIRRLIIERECVATARYGRGSGHTFGKHGPHAIIRLDSDDFLSPVDQHSGHCSRPCAKVNHPADMLLEHPLDRRYGRSGTIALVLRSNLTETACPLR
jgi:hypothetical protein